MLIYILRWSRTWWGFGDEPFGKIQDWKEAAAQRRKATGVNGEAVEADTER